MGEALSDKLRSKGTLLMVCLLGLFLMGMYGAVLVKASETEVTFEKVQEKTYDEFIRGIAFGFTSEHGKDQAYCKMIWLDEKEVQFLNESGEIISTESLVAAELQEEGKYTSKGADFSCDGNFAAIHEYVIAGGDAMNYIVEDHCIIFDEKGQEIYAIEGIVEGRDGMDRFLISDRDGSAVGTRLVYGALDFYSPDGTVKTVHLFGDLGWGKSTGGKAVFSEDGEYVAVLVGGSAKRPPALRPLNSEVWVMLFDKSGNELWRRKVDQDRYGNIAISQKGEYVFFKAYAYVEKFPRGPARKGEKPKLASVTLGLYDREGAELSFEDKALFSFGSFCFSPQADYVALAGGNRIRLMRTKDGSTVFEKELPESGRIRQLLFSADGEYLIVNPEINPLLIFNMKGELVWQHYFYSRIREIFSGSRFLAFSFPYRYEIFKKIEKER